MLLGGVDPVAELSMKGKTPRGKAEKVYNRNKGHLSKTLL